METAINIPTNTLTAAAPNTEAQTPPLTTKTTTSSSYYYAIRHGQSVNNCIFVSWEDAKSQVLEYDSAEYSSFDSVQKALEYLNHSGQFPASNSHMNRTNNNNNDINRGTCRMMTNNTTVSTGSIGDSGVSSPTRGGGSSSDVATRPTAGATGTTQQTTITDVVGNSMEMEGHNDLNNRLQNEGNNTIVDSDALLEEIEYPSEVLKVPQHNTFNHPNHQQQQQDQLGMEIDENELDDGEEEEDDDNLPLSILKTPSMNHCHKKRQLNDMNTIQLTKKRIRLAKETETIQVDGRTIYKRRPSKNWMAMFRKLQEYKQKTGSFYVNSNDEEHIVLKRWISEQRHQYKCYKMGKKHFSSHMKRQLLINIGFDFEFYIFDEKIEELKQFKEEHGMNIDVPKDHPELGSWMEAQKRQLFLYNKGKESKLNHDQVQQLKNAGVNVLKVTKPSARPRQETSAHVKKWESMFEKMKEYKKTNSNCQVPKSDVNHQELYKWVCQQRLEYKKLKNDQGNRMTASRLQKLNDLGFNFNPRSSYMRWDERMDQLREFKKKNGHLRVPVSDPDIGEFVARQRVEYAKLMDGKSCNITQERVNDLTELGFVFQVGKRRVTEVKVVRKTWEERFAELLEYKEKNGNCLVPQSCPLGEWVHKQRKMYKMLKSGKQCSLTTERALKLSDVGFVFDASGYRRGRKVVDDTIAVVPMPVAQFPTHPDTYEHMNMNININMNNM